MRKPLTRIQLSAEEQEQLAAFVKRGTRSVRAVRRAQVLLALHGGQSPSQAADMSGVSLGTVYNVYHRYQADGVGGVLHEKPRPGQPQRLNLAQQARLTSLACSEPPTGRVRWTLRLLADRAVELGIVEGIAPETVRQFLKKTPLNRG